MKRTSQNEFVPFPPRYAQTARSRCYYVDSYVYKDRYRGLRPYNCIWSSQHNTHLAMKFALVCLLTFVIVAYVSAQPQQYTNKYDNIDVDQILNNDRLLKRYADCLLEKSVARCPPDAIELKNVLNDALETECAKCNDRQKEMVKKVVKFLVTNKPEIWSDLKAKYDPEGKYTTKYEEMAREEGVQL